MAKYCHCGCKLIVPGILTFLVIICVFCQNSTKVIDADTPLSVDRRLSPQDLIDQLVESYESKRLDLFIDLLPDDNSFKFFVAPGYVEEYRTKHVELIGMPDTNLMFVESDSCYYWEQLEEIDKHMKMFKGAKEIEFKMKPFLSSIRWFENGVDSLAEIVVNGGKLVLDVINGDSIETYQTFVDNQVLLIQLDSGHRWVIKQWYDFSTNGSYEEE